jgi:hypothetical protein
MALGLIPGNNLRAYYRLENTNDSSGNGFNLTNENSVDFNTGLFGNAADFGTSGTDKRLIYSSGSVFTANKVASVVMFWFKLNSTANTSRNHRLITFRQAATDGRAGHCDYTITSGVVNIVYVASGGTASITFTADNNWHLVRLARTGGSGTTNFNIRVDMRFISANSVSDAVGTGNAGIAIGGILDGANTLQPFSTIDEVIVDEVALYGASLEAVPNSYRYFTQAKGRFCI